MAVVAGDRSGLVLISARSAVFVVALLGVTALVLRAMGRPWWCEAGDLSLWSTVIRSRHNSQHLADAYTVTHVLHGIAFYFLAWAALRRFASLRTRAVIAMIVEAVWEIVENTDAVIERYRAATISLDYYGDSVTNSLADVVACAIGYAVATLLPAWISLVGFFAVDALLLVWIRDSLLLNVLMLVRPIDAVRRWQGR